MGEEEKKRRYKPLILQNEPGLAMCTAQGGPAGRPESTQKGKKNGGEAGQQRVNKEDEEGKQLESKNLHR